MSVVFELFSPEGCTKTPLLCDGEDAKKICRLARCIGTQREHIDDHSEHKEQWTTAQMMIARSINLLLAIFFHSESF